tara:strand:+ start:395 stop:853 length:459 start_codon:yes stop_codon:yes gene_type:complete
MALTQVGKEGIIGISNSSDATFLTVDSSEQAVIKSEGGAATTSVQQGLIKAWADVDQTGTMTVDNSFNIGSSTDLAAGNFTLNFTNAMGNADYGMAGAAHQKSAGNDEGIVCFQLPDARTTGDCDLRTVDVYNAADVLDYDPTTAMFYGDLA